MDLRRCEGYLKEIYTPKILDPIDTISWSESRSPSVEEIPVRPGNFQDVFLWSLQVQDFLPKPPTGNEVFVEETPQIIEIFVEDQLSTSTGKQHNQKTPTWKPQACLKRKSKEDQPGTSQKKPENI